MSAITSKCKLLAINIFGAHKFNAIIAEGIKAKKNICSYYDYLFSCNNPGDTDYWLCWNGWFCPKYPKCNWSHFLQKNIRKSVLQVALHLKYKQEKLCNILKTI